MEKELLKQLIELYDHALHRSRHVDSGEAKLELEIVLSKLGSIIDRINATILWGELVIKRNGGLHVED